MCKGTEALNRRSCAAFKVSVGTQSAQSRLEVHLIGKSTCDPEEILLEAPLFLRLHHEADRLAEKPVQVHDGLMQTRSATT